MAIEIERKFLLRTPAWKQLVHRSTHFAQGYLASEPGRTVRVRIAGERGFLTIKGSPQGLSRAEYEYEIPLQDARELLALCPKTLTKVRHLVSVPPHTWEIDEFLGDNLGLWVAEIELSSEQESFHRPDWLGKEVTSDHRYANSALIREPFLTWSTSSTELEHLFAGFPPENE